MRRLGIRGVVRGKKVITTQPDTSQPCPDDKVNRLFKADRPNKLWVSDFTYVPTWSGTVDVAFVIDVFARRIVGWRASPLKPAWRRSYVRYVRISPSQTQRSAFLRPTSMRPLSQNRQVGNPPSPEARASLDKTRIAMARATFCSALFVIFFKVSFSGICFRTDGQNCMNQRFVASSRVRTRRSPVRPPRQDQKQRKRAPHRKAQANSADKIPFSEFFHNPDGQPEIMIQFYIAPTC
jgi:hypothetical protein